MKYSESNHRTLRRGIEEKQRNAVLNYIYYRIDEMGIQGFCNREEGMRIKNIRIFRMGKAAYNIYFRERKKPGVEIVEQPVRW